VLEAVKVWPRKSEAYRKVGAPANLDSPLRATTLALLRVGTKKRAFRSNKETDEGRHALHCLSFLTKEAPYKGPGADSEEKREPVSDIDIAVADSLKVLDLKRPIREATYLLRDKEMTRRAISGR
jgi:hypothetical protein